MTASAVTRGRFHTGVRPAVRRAGRVVFGDRAGLAVWLGLVVALALTWRVGFFIQDSYAVANAVVNVADGDLAVRQVRYSLTLGSQPGLHESGGALYARNYGQVFLAVPVVYALQVATLVAPLHVVLAAGWSLALLAFARQAATVTGRSAVRHGGAILALLAFAVTLRRVTPVDPTALHLVALQLSTLFAAAFAGVCLYRLVGVFHGDRVALAAGVGVVVAFPLGFWATIPKRHVLVATLLVASVYCFARSREATGRRATGAIAGAYLFASLIAWTHAFEGFFALAALGSVDLVTGGVRGRRRVAVVALALAVGLAPMFLTNAAISGNPMEPPRLLPNHGSGDLELGPGGVVESAGGEPTGSTGAGATGSSGETGGTADGGGSGDSGDGASTASADAGATGDSGDDGSSGDGSGPSTGGGNPLSLLAPVLGAAGKLVGEVEFVLAFVTDAVLAGLAVLSKPDRLWHVFVRSGRIPGVRYAINGFEVVELTVLESAPLLGALLALPAVCLARVRERTPGSIHDVRAVTPPWALSPRRQTDLLVVVLWGLLTVVYLPRLPLISQITVRYVLDAMPLALYGVVRIPVVREAVGRSPRRLVGGYAVAGIGSLTGSVLVLGLLDVAVGEAMQFHALVNLGVAGLLGALVAGRTLAPEHVPAGWVGAGLAVAAGVTTTFLALAGLEYFQYGPFALDISRLVSASIPLF